jgi:hypothetical protein
MEAYVDEFMNKIILLENDCEHWLKWASHEKQQNIC